MWQQINYPLDKPSDCEFAYQMACIEGAPQIERVSGVLSGGVRFERHHRREAPSPGWKFVSARLALSAGATSSRRPLPLQEEGGGTRLTIAVRTRVTTHFNWYAGLWADYLVDDTAGAILNFYKVRAEAAS